MKSKTKFVILSYLYFLYHGSFTALAQIDSLKVQKSKISNASLDLSYQYISRNPVSHLLGIQFNSSYFFKNKLAFYLPLGVIFKFKKEEILQFAYVGLGIKFSLKEWVKKNEHTRLYLQTDFTGWKYDRQTDNSRRLTHILGVKYLSMKDKIGLFIEMGITTSNTSYIDYSSLSYRLNIGLQLLNFNWLVQYLFSNRAVYNKF